MAPGKTSMSAQRATVVTLFVVCVVASVVAQERSARIVSIVPALTEALFAVGAGAQVVGVGTFDTTPPEVASRPRVGGLLDPDLERIFALRPDLVVLYGSQTDQQSQLVRAGIDVFPYAHGGLTETLATLRDLAVRVGRSRAGDTLVRNLESRLTMLRKQTAGRPRPRVLLVFGREPGSLRNIYASGGTGFLHDLLEAAGGRNVFANVARESVQLTSEAILAAAPEVILELTYDDRMTAATQASEVAVWTRLPSVPAVRGRRVYLLLGNHFVQPGPRIADAAVEMARALHPDVFQ